MAGTERRATATRGQARDGTAGRGPAGEARIGKVGPSEALDGLARYCTAGAADPGGAQIGRPRRGTARRGRQDEEEQVRVGLSAAGPGKAGITISYLPHRSGLRRIVVRMDPEFAIQLNGTHARKRGPLQGKAPKQVNLSTGRRSRPGRTGARAK